MAVIDYTTLFTRLGKIGKVGYALAGSQSAVPATVTAIVSLYESTADVDLIGPVLNIRTSIPDPVVTPASSVAGLAATTLVRAVAASVTSVSAVPEALVELIRQMGVSGQTIKACVVAVTASALSTNSGDGVVVLSTKRGDGLVQENTIPEVARLACSRDSFTGGATAGREQFQLTGQPATAPLWNYNYPTGSAAAPSVDAVDYSATATATGNILTNSDFEYWSGALSTDSLDNWTLETGAWGTNAQQSTTAYSGTNSLRILPTAANTAVYQEFDNGADGTTIALTAYTSYAINFRMRALAATISAGVLTVELVDDAGVVVTNGQGVANSFTVTLSALTTAWVAVNGVFQMPEEPPATVRLRLRVSTALVGSSAYVDGMAMTPLTAAYGGGWGFAVFAGATPFRVNDGWDVTATNNYGGSTYLASFQPLFNRLFGTAQMGLLLPSATVPTISDTLITA